MPRAFLLIFIIIHFQFIVDGQTNISQHFLTGNGLPSNFTYKSIEDKQGYLWVSTDQGIARFDGVRFQVYGTQEGLPDMDVYKMELDRHGILWVIGVNKGVAYFNKSINRFVQVTSVLKSLGIHGDKWIFTNDQVDVIIHHEKGTTFFDYPNLYHYPFKRATDSTFVFSRINDQEEIRYTSMKKVNAPYAYLYHTKKGMVLDKLILDTPAGGGKYYPYKQYLLVFKRDEKQVKIIDQISISPLKMRIRYLELPQGYFWHNMNRDEIVAEFKNGQVICYNLKTLKVSRDLNFQKYVLHMMQDSKKNWWLSLQDNGLTLIRPTHLATSLFDVVKSQGPFLSVCVLPNGELLTGNSYGEITSYTKKAINYKPKENRRSTDLMRQIIFSQSKLYTFGENGILRDRNNQVVVDRKPCKAACAINDSIIACGYDYGLALLNTKRDLLNYLHLPLRYISSLARLNDSSFYIGTRDSLYLYHWFSGTFRNVLQVNEQLSDHITALCTTPDKVLWVGTAGHGIYAIYKNHLQLHLSEEQEFSSNTIHSIVAGGSGQVWIGTHKGILKIDYQQPKPSLQYITTNDGLVSNVINQLCYSNQIIYAATDNGISTIRENLHSPKYKILLGLNSVRIDNQEAILKNNYSLSPKQHNIVVQVSGIELGGHFKEIQYSIDKGLSWMKMENNTLAMQLNSGWHPLWFKASDVNGYSSSSVLKLEFNVATPFYKTWIFYISLIIASVLVALLLYHILLQYKHQQQIKKLAYRQALDEFELKALKAQINPHFVFNCMNSIKSLLYANHIDLAEVYLDRFADLLRTTLNFSGLQQITLADEMDYIQNYMELEKLRFGKLFAFDIHMDANVQQNEWTVPAMLLQPYVENAIKHGISNLKNKEGYIAISAEVNENKLLLMIEDNGVGRDVSAQVKRSGKKRHESKGMHITERRATLHQIDCKVLDKFDQMGKFCGTIVQLTLPLKHKDE